MPSLPSHPSAGPGAPSLSATPLVWPAAALGAGVWAAGTWAPAAPFIAGGLLLAAAALYLAARRRLEALLLCAAALGALTCMWHTPASLPAGLDGRRALCAGRVDDASENESGGWMLRVSVDSVGGAPAPRRFLARLSTLTLSPAPRPGQRITFRTTLHEPREALSVPDEPDLSAWLRRQGIAAVGYIYPDDMLALTGEPSAPWRCRRAASQAIARIGLDDATAGFLDAALLGDDSMLAPGLRDTLASAGIAHILALSGLHVGILAMVVAWMLWPLSHAGWPRWRMGVTIGALWAFAWVTGMGVSVVRAVVMATMVLGARMLRVEHSALNSLCAAALLILFFQPMALWTPGFQMSFAAVAAILLAAPLNPFGRRNGVLRAVAGYLLATLAAMATAGAMAVVWFHHLPLLFLVGNLLPSLLLPPLLTLGVVLALWACVAQVPAWLAAATCGLYRLMVAGSEALTAHGHSTLDDIYCSPWQLVLWLLAVMALLRWAWCRKRIWGAAAATLVALTALAAVVTRPAFPPYESFRLEHGSHAALLVRDADSLWVVTRAPGRARADLQAQVAERYDSYRGRRGLRRFTVAPDTLQRPGITRQGPWVSVATPSGRRVTYAMLGEADSVLSLPRGLKVDTLLLTATFCHDAVAADSVLGWPPVVICHDVAPSRRRAIERRLRRRGL